jgi:hypothetical protein
MRNVRPSVIARSHAEAQSAKAGDAAIHGNHPLYPCRSIFSFTAAMDCFAALAMTGNNGTQKKKGGDCSPPFFCILADR